MAITEKDYNDMRTEDTGKKIARKHHSTLPKLPTNYPRNEKINMEKLMDNLIIKTMIDRTLGDERDILLSDMPKFIEPEYFPVAIIKDTDTRLNLTHDQTFFIKNSDEGAKPEDTVNLILSDRVTDKFKFHQVYRGEIPRFEYRQYSEEYWKNRYNVICGFHRKIKSHLEYLEKFRGLLLLILKTHKPDLITDPNDPHFLPYDKEYIPKNSSKFLLTDLQNIDGDLNNLTDGDIKLNDGDLNNLNYVFEVIKESRSDLYDLQQIIEAMPDGIDYDFGNFFLRGRRDKKLYKCFDIYENLNEFIKANELIRICFEKNSISFNRNEAIKEYIIKENLDDLLDITPYHLDPKKKPQPLDYYKALKNKPYEFFDTFVLFVERIFDNTRIFHPDYECTETLDEIVHETQGEIKCFLNDFLTRKLFQTNNDAVSEIEKKIEEANFDHIFKVHVAMLHPDSELYEAYLCMGEHAINVFLISKWDGKIVLLGELPYWEEKTLTHETLGQRLIIKKMVMSEDDPIKNEYIFKDKYIQVISDAEAVKQVKIVQAGRELKLNHFTELSYQLHDGFEGRDICCKMANYHTDDKNEEVYENIYTNSTKFDGIFVLFDSKASKTHFDKILKEKSIEKSENVLNKYEEDPHVIPKTFHSVFRNFQEKLKKENAEKDEKGIENCENYNSEKLPNHRILSTGAQDFYSDLFLNETVIQKFKVKFSQTARQYAMIDNVFLNYEMVIDLELDRELLEDSYIDLICEVHFKEKNILGKFKTGFIIILKHNVMILSTYSHLTTKKWMIRPEYVFCKTQTHDYYLGKELWFEEKPFERVSQINLDMMDLFEDEDERLFYSRILEEIEKKQKK